MPKTMETEVATAASAPDTNEEIARLALLLTVQKFGIGPERAVLAKDTLNQLLEIRDMLLRGHGITPEARETDGAPTPRALDVNAGMSLCQTVLLARRTLGANYKRAEGAERECDRVIEAMTPAQKRDALVFAAWRGKEAAVRRLLTAGVDKDAVASEGVAVEGLTALCAAADSGYERILALLLEVDADSNKADSDGTGWTPLMFAAYNNDGWTPIVEVASRNTPHIVAMLLEAGADKTPVDEEGMTALQWEERGHTQAQVAALLRE